MTKNRPFGQGTSYPQDAWELLAPRLTPSRRNRLSTAAASRTRRVRLVVQDIHHPHNISACLRSAEAFGVQDVDVVTMTETFRASTVARGVAGWLNVHRHLDVESCVRDLRSSGHRIFAGVPTEDAIPLYDLPVDRPVAVVFGNEHKGIHPDWREHIDQTFTIPMVGLVESLNISVCAAITLNHLTRHARQVLGDDTYFLTAAERHELLCEWICRQIPSWQGELGRLRS